MFTTARARGGGRGRRKKDNYIAKPRAVSVAVLITPLGACKICRPLHGAFKDHFHPAAAEHFCPASPSGCKDKMRFTSSRCSVGTATSTACPVPGRGRLRVRGMLSAPLHASLTRTYAEKTLSSILCRVRLARGGSLVRLNEPRISGRQPQPGTPVRCCPVP